MIGDFKYTVAWLPCHHDHHKHRKTFISYKPQNGRNPKP
jgi:hypothetical protein